jgi:hypothetical protein
MYDFGRQKMTTIIFVSELAKESYSLPRDKINMEYNKLNISCDFDEILSQTLQRDLALTDAKKICERHCESNFGFQDFSSGPIRNLIRIDNFRQSIMF